MQTERVTFLTSPDQKAKLDAFAVSQGQSVGHIVREATSRYIAGENDVPTSEEEAELAALVAEANIAIPKMNVALDEMLATLRATREDIDRSLRAMGARA